jgi:predicted DNA-binding transcriptional regulator AlpA
MQTEIENPASGKHILSDLKALPEQDDVLIAAAHVPAYIGLKAQTLARWRHEGNPPRYYRLGGRVFYRAGDLRDWIRAQVRDNTTEI